MFFDKRDNLDWLNGTFGDACKACVELFFSRLVWLCGIVVVLLYFVSESPNSDYDWTASTIFSKVIWIAAFVAIFEVFVRRYYNKLGDGPVAEGTKAVMENRRKNSEKTDG